MPQCDGWPSSGAVRWLPLQSDAWAVYGKVFNGEEWCWLPGTRHPWQANQQWLLLPLRNCVCGGWNRRKPNHQMAHTRLCHSGNKVSAWGSCLPGPVQLSACVIRSTSSSSRSPALTWGRLAASSSGKSLAPLFFVVLRRPIGKRKRTTQDFSKPPPRSRQSPRDETNDSLYLVCICSSNC